MTYVHAPEGYPSVGVIDPTTSSRIKDPELAQVCQDTERLIEDAVAQLDDLKDLLTPEPKSKILSPDVVDSFIEKLYGSDKTDLDYAASLFEQLQRPSMSKHGNNKTKLDSGLSFYIFEDKSDRRLRRAYGQHISQTGELLSYWNSHTSPLTPSSHAELQKTIFEPLQKFNTEMPDSSALKALEGD